MGLYVTWEARLVLDDPENIRVEADVDVLIPKNTTLH